MMKKYVLLGTMAAFLASANIAEAPIRNMSPPTIERKVITKEIFGKSAKEIDKELNRVIEELKFRHDDEVYSTICEVSGNLGMEIPEYITNRLLRKVADIESGGYPFAIGKDGERGTMQLLKETWYVVQKYLGENKNFEKNAFNPYENIRASLVYFLMKNEDFEANYPKWESLPDSEKIKMLIASYNGGFGYLRTNKWKISKMKPVTKDYVKRISRNMDFILSDYEYQSKKF